MTPYVDCTFAQARLEACVDDELPIGDQILVESHLRWCSTCRARVEDLQIIRSAVRIRASGVDSAERHQQALAAMRAEVLRRVEAEREQSWGTRLQGLERAFTDLRFVWPALGATAAAVLCIGLTTTVWRAASTDEPTSLAGMIESLSEPGSDRNPLRLDGGISVPRMLNTDGSVMQAVLDGHDGDEVLAVAAIVKRDGKIGTYELLGSGARLPHHATLAGGEESVADLLAAVRDTRFAPAQWPAGRTVAVKAVLIFAKTTVRASAMPVDLGVPLSRPLPPRPAHTTVSPVAPEPVGITEPASRPAPDAVPSASERLATTDALA
jgi:hypothetical protein